MSFLSISRHLFVLLGLFALTSQLPAQEVSPSDFFKVAYRTQRAEREKIKTWTGKLRCREKALFSNPPKYIVEKLTSGQKVSFREIRFDSEFSVDTTQARLFSTFQPTEKIDFLDANGSVLTSSDERGYNNRTLNTERTLTLRPWQAPGRQKDDPTTRGWKASNSRLLEESSREKSAGRVAIGDIIDPLKLFDPPAYDFIGYLQLLSENTDANYFGSLKLRKERNSEGEVFVWDSGDPPGRFVAEYRVAEYAGYHLVGYRLYDRQLECLSCKVDVEYTRIAGVIVPRRYEMQKMSEDGLLIGHSRTYEFSDQFLNQPLDEQVFTIKNLGAHPGDRVIDREAGTLKMVNGNLDVVSVADFEKEYANGFEEHVSEARNQVRIKIEPVQKKGRWWQVFAMNGIAIVSIVAISTMWKRVRWRRKSDVMM